MTDADEMAYEAFATLHPLAAYADGTERFVAFALRACPGLTREDLVRTLRATCETDPADPEAQMCLAALNEEAA